jgi:hypothetical protein
VDSSHEFANVRIHTVAGRVCMLFLSKKSFKLSARHFSTPASTAVVARYQRNGDPLEVLKYDFFLKIK